MLDLSVHQLREASTTIKFDRTVVEVNNNQNIRKRVFRDPFFFSATYQSYKYSHTFLNKRNLGLGETWQIQKISE